MGIPAGPWYVDDLLTFTVNTHDVATGAGTDADSVPSYRVYEDETGTAILTGNMAKLDDTNTVGFYSEQITLSAANGFEVGKSYSIYITATVDSVAATQSHNFKVIATPASAPSAATVAAAVWAEATRTLTSLGNGSGLSAIPWNAAWDAEVQSECADALTAYDPPTHAELTSATSNLDATVSSRASAANLATVAGYLDTEIAAILQDTGTDIPAQIAALNNLSAAQVNAEVDTALADYDAPTKAELDAAVAPLATQASVNDLPTNAELTAALAGLSTQASVDAVAVEVDEVWRLLGLDPAAPFTVTPDAMTATGIDIAISGDGETTTTLTRAP